MPALTPLLLTVALAQAAPGGGTEPTPAVEAEPLEEGEPLGYEPLRSLLGGRTLGAGGIAFQAFGGFPALGVAYAQGVSDASDVGLLLQLDWAATDVLVAGQWRYSLSRSDSAYLAFTTRAGYFGSFGATYVYSPNASDQGGQLAPGLTFSLDAGRALFTVAAEFPGTVTFYRGGGFIFAPLGSVAYELPLGAQLALGLRAGAGARWASGGAPGAGSTRALLELTAVATWRVF